MRYSEAGELHQETETFVEPITASELAEDFDGYAQWLVEQGWARQQDNLVIPHDSSKAPVIEYDRDKQRVVSVYFNHHGQDESAFYRIAFKKSGFWAFYDKPESTIVEFSRKTYGDGWGESGLPLFFSRQMISPRDHQAQEFLDDLAAAIESRINLGEPVQTN